MKKILFVIHDLMGGGAERVLVNLVNNLDAEKYDITVAAIFGEGVYVSALNENIKFRSLFKKSFNGNKYFFRLFSPEFWYKKLTAGEHYDIAVAYLEGTCARFVAGCDDKSTKKIAWIHATLSPDGYKICFKNKAEADRLYSRFDKIICVSQSLKEKFCLYNSLYDKTQVLYNVNETDKIKAAALQNVEEKNLFNPDVPCIAFVGKVMKNKGIHRLAEIHVRLKKDGVPHRFLIIGEGAERADAESYLKEKNASDDFVFLGFQKNPYKYLARCDLFVCASYAEGFSTAATEALILGVPCVVTDCSGMKEMLGSNNEYGIVSENSTDALYDAIKKMLTTPGMIDEYKKRASVRGQDFTMEKTLSKTEEFFDNI